MNEKIYLHSINCYEMNEQILSFLDIVKNGEIISLRRQGKTESTSFAGLDYISLSDYEKRFLYPEKLYKYNAFNIYSRYGISFAFNKEDLEVIIPAYCHFCGVYKQNLKTMKRLGNSVNRYSDFLDEVQVKDSVSLDNLSFVTFPTKMYFNREFFYSKNHKYKKLLENIKQIHDILKYFNNDKEIYDIDTKIKMDEEGIIKLVYKK